MQSQTLGLPTTVYFSMDGALVGSGSSVTGTFRLQQFATPGPVPPVFCTSPTQDIAFTGTVNAANLLTLTSSGGNAGTVTITLQLPLGVGGAAYGTSQITGGSCALAATGAVGILVPSASGTYTGTMTPFISLAATPPVTTGAGPVTLTLVQASSANVDGQFPLTGTFSYAGSTCTVMSTFSGVISGLAFTITSPTASGTLPLYQLTGAAAPENGLAALLDLNLISAGSATCPATLYNASTLTKQ